MLSWASCSIDVAHFSPIMPDDLQASKNYYDALSEVIKGGKIRVRRILIINTKEQMGWAKKMLQEFSGKNFFLGCYPTPSYYIPMLSLFIVDDKEVVLTGGERIPSYDVNIVAIKHSNFREMAKRQFETLWAKSIRLNEGNINWKLFEELESIAELSCECEHKKLKLLSQTL